MKQVANYKRLNIAILRKRNVDKSSLINSLLGQDLAIVSEVAGTTTNTVKKAVKLLPFKPIAIVDTAGIDHECELGEKSIRKALIILYIT